jgi:hypothetical protein
MNCGHDPVMAMLAGKLDRRRARTEPTRCHKIAFAAVATD